MENPIIDDLGGKPTIFGNTHVKQPTFNLQQPTFNRNIPIGKLTMEGIPIFNTKYIDSSGTSMF